MASVPVDLSVQWEFQRGGNRLLRICRAPDIMGG